MNDNRSYHLFCKKPYPIPAETVPVAVWVSAGTGTVWEIPTCGLPVFNPSHVPAYKQHLYAMLIFVIHNNI